VSPVVFVTTILFRDPSAEVSYPRFKATIYLMQYCNHSLNFIFYGITSPPYRRTLCEWFRVLFPHLPQCCQRTIRERSKSLRFENISMKQINRLDGAHHTPHRPIGDRTVQKEAVSLIPR
ncbi:unnamed protein product, partial [Adineta ricciae]